VKRGSSLPPLPAPLAVSAQPLAPAPAAAPAPLLLPHPAGAWRFLAYLASFFTPPLGLAFAFLYWKGGDDAVRRFSRFALALAVLGALLSAGSDAFEAGMQSGEWFIQPY
jgi:hypothetical protein